VDERRRQPSFSPETLAEILGRWPPVKRYWLAYSGGCDSHVLLHAAAQLQRRGAIAPLHAVHIDHGLHPASADWARHCTAVCASLELPLLCLRVNARPAPGESPEAAARQARYRAIAEVTEPGDCLLTAHHQDDQAETLLLQLLRGGGPHGLAAMPELAPFARGQHARPLLAFPRAELQGYAEAQGLRWIDDPSNADTGYDRNYLRREVLPALRGRWPAVARVLTRSAAHQAEAAQLLDVLAAQDLVSCRSEQPACLDIPSLLKLDEARQRNALRFWLKNLGYKLPDTVRLAHVQRDVLQAAQDRMPVVSWEGVELRRYREHLYALAPPAPGEVNAILTWDLHGPLRLPDGASLTALPAQGKGVKAALSDAAVTVRFRQGGEHCQISPRGSTRPLKKLLQERGVPPWLRERIPLLYVGERLAAVADYWVCAPFHAAADERGVTFEWHVAASETDRAHEKN